MSTPDTKPEIDTLKTLPGDDVRQIMWRFADRYDLQMLVQATRSVARGPVARLVAEGVRNSHEWNEAKASLLKAFDEAGVTTAGIDPKFGGYIEGPKNLALALVAFELSWVDGGAATCSLAGNLALAPIHERGTEEQKQKYFTGSVPLKPGENRKLLRGAFALTEPLPYVGVETGMLSGKMRVAEWVEGQEPILQIEKRGRFITNMGFANYVTAAVDTDDPRIKSSCMVILEDTDPGLFDRGTPARKLVHQLSSTRDPVFNLKVPASRIIGGYSIKEGKIVPRYSHGEVIEAVFKRTRVTVGLMTTAKLLSAIEPLIRYHRNRFRGGNVAQPGTPRYDLGIQQKEDALHRTLDVWGMGEAGASLGFATARLFDLLDPMEKKKDEVFEKQGVQGARAQFKVLAKVEKDALEFLRMSALPEEKRDAARYAHLKNDTLVQYMLLDSLANVMCPACKLWNTGYGANAMREAVSMMGGYGITEDCPGFLGHKWTDIQLEATYEGPEAVQRRQMSLTMTSALFLAQFRQWIVEMREIAARRPGTGACTLATAMQLWLWTLNHLQAAVDGNGNKIYTSGRQGATFALADALCWLLASRCQILDLLELEEKGVDNLVVAEGLAGLLRFMTDLCHAQAARAAGEAGKACAELVYGYNSHPAWDGDPDVNACVATGTTEEISGYIAGTNGNCIDSGACKVKAGPCVQSEKLAPFIHLRTKLDSCMTGCRLAKERAAGALAKVMIPEALDYPV